MCFIIYTNSCPCNTGTLRGTDTLIIYIFTLVSLFVGTIVPSWPGPPPHRGFLFTLRHTSLVKSPLDEWSDRLINVYLTTHSTHKRLISMPLMGFEPAVPAIKRPYAHALHITATGIGFTLTYFLILLLVFHSDTATPPLKPFLLSPVFFWEGFWFCSFREYTPTTVSTF